MKSEDFLVQREPTSLLDWPRRDKNQHGVVRCSMATPQAFNVFSIT